jgi:hypothetical protein
MQRGLTRRYVDPAQMRPPASAQLQQSPRTNSQVTALPSRSTLESGRSQVQLIGPPGSEALLLATGCVIERTAGWRPGS